MVFVAAILGALEYSGLVNRLGEWQFSHFGFYLPMISVLGWVGLAALIVWAVTWLLRRSRRAPPRPSAIRGRRTILRNGLIALGFVAGMVALAGAVNLSTLPGTEQADRLIVPATLGPGAEGNARLQGFHVAGPVARYTQGVLFWRNDTYLVPLAGGAPGSRQPVQLFAQVTPYEVETRLPSAYQGILRQAAVPRELYPLFATQGVMIDNGAAVLFRDAFSMALPTLLLIGEAALVAIVAFITAAVVHRRRRRRRPGKRA